MLFFQIVYMGQTVVICEDMASGQRINAYMVNYGDITEETWSNETLQVTTAKIFTFIEKLVYGEAK